MKNLVFFDILRKYCFMYLEFRSSTCHKNYDVRKDLIPVASTDYKKINFTFISQQMFSSFSDNKKCF